MKIGIKLQSLIPIFIYCFSAERQALEPTCSRNIIKLQTIDNHSLFGVYSKSKSF